jgi:ABC-type bacteriocin/lantibiotic exporter with double-glycine peptidase domain
MRGIPLFFQSEKADCGVACLAMVLSYHRIPFSQRDLRSTLDVGRDGVSARRIAECARQYGLHANGVRIATAAVRQLAAGSVLFWSAGHYVVLESATMDEIRIVDPRFGRRRLTTAEFDAVFSGVAIELTATSPRMRSPRPHRTMPSRGLAPLRPVPPQRLLAITLLSLASAALVLLAPVMLLVVKSPWWVPNPLTMVAVVGLVGCYGVVDFARRCLFDRIRHDGELATTNEICRQVLAVPSAELSIQRPQDLATAIRTGRVINNLIPASMELYVVDFLTSVAVLIGVLVLDWRTALVVTAAAALQLAVLAWGWQRQHDLVAAVVERRTTTDNELHELLTRRTTAKALGVEKMLIESWSSLLADESAARSRATRMSAWYAAVTGAFQFAVPLAVFTIHLWRIADRSEAPVTALAWVFMSFLLAGSVGRLSIALWQAVGAGPLLAKTNHWLGRDGGPASEPPAAPTSVALTDVIFRYPGQQRAVLDMVDLTVAAGSFVAITGRSGSGTSTLLSVMAGVDPPRSGRITVDGTDIGTLDGPALRESIGYLDQDAAIFPGTVESNIMIGRKTMSLADMTTAACLAGLHERIVELPLRYQTPASALSDGERRQVAIARLLSSGRRLLLLDRPVDGLSATTAKQIMWNLVAAGHTIVVVTDNPVVLGMADRTLVLTDGRLREAMPAEVIEGSAHD